MASNGSTNFSKKVVTPIFGLAQVTPDSPLTSFNGTAAITATRLCRPAWAELAFTPPGHGIPFACPHPTRHRARPEMQSVLRSRAHVRFRCYSGYSHQTLTKILDFCGDYVSQYKSRSTNWIWLLSDFWENHDCVF